MAQPTALQDKLDGVELPAAADMHVHLRDGDMTKLIVYVNNGTYYQMMICD
jgi:dihydroorotase